MFNNINENNFLYGNSQLEQQGNVLRLNMFRSKNAENVYSNNKSPYVDKTEISSDAIQLFERDCDIKKFNNIAMSDMNDNSHLDRMKELFADGVIDAYEDDVIDDLVNNLKLYNDLEL